MDQSDKERLALAEYRLDTHAEMQRDLQASLKEISKWMEQITTSQLDLVKLQTQQVHVRERMDRLEERIDEEIKARREDTRDVFSRFGLL